jgi:type I restriction enzyme S subunit
VISPGPSILQLAEFVNGYPFKPDQLGTEGLPVVRIRQLVDPSAEVDYADPPSNAVYIDDGDLVFAWSGSLEVRLWSRGRALLNQHLFRVDPYTGIERRWLRYVLEVGTDRLAPLMHGSAMTHVTRDMLRLLKVDVPSLITQQRIADFLDAETARIDALIEKKRRMMGLVSEQTEARVELELRAAANRHGETPLKHMAREVTVGIVVTPAQWYAEDGVPALRGINVVPGRVRLDDLVFLTAAGHALHPKSRLANGDLVTVRSGQAGATAVVPEELHGANCVDLLITRPRTCVSAAYLEAVMNSDWCRKHVAKHSVGAIQSHFNVEALKGLPVPSLPSDEQEALAYRLREARRKAERLVMTLERQIDLLMEHRQALITAAVTGELDLAEAA